LCSVVSLSKSGKTVNGNERKQKLLDKQKEGKKKLKAIGSVEIDSEVFVSVMKLK
jgi:translation elongation factor EF-4